ncbi:hypothetical protein [Microcoleus sp. herbarium12]|uniref:hypothetical protein n=1 Tax=Microcoleus sp. herbarium12 TaxID=3055437 RepID=UPI002FD57212
MIVRQPRYSKEEFAVAGDRIYESQFRPQVETGDRGKILAIDIQTRALARSHFSQQISPHPPPLQTAPEPLALPLARSPT